ncbi:MAG: hypothetical protein CO189_06900 [candidate division Zixibacteria bacterium CG_4_9_14_3_um_filter_46_8]|nr:MAG: hypothetical protein CO189_06900 [candidate division Zixibacteria bacterium CG_4_9_14_3_um_filter_46_8]
MRVVGIIVIVLLAACVIVVRPAWVGGYQLPSYRDVDWNSVGIPGSINDYQSAFINEDHFVDLARVMGSSVEIYLNPGVSSGKGGRFADGPSMVIGIDDFEKATAKGSLIGSRWPYLVQKYGVRTPPNQNEPVGHITSAQHLQWTNSVRRNIRHDRFRAEVGIHY